MLSHSPFYHETIRNVIVGFGRCFRNIKIQRIKDSTGQVEQEIAVPIAYAPKEKWIQRVEQDPDLDDGITYTTLPRLSFEMTGMSYDPLRRLNRLASIQKSTSTGRDKVWAPVPYNIDIALYALTKTTEDGLQIIEQIVPYFTPEFTMSVQGMRSPLDIITDVPVILNSVSFVDDYDGTFEIRRFVTWTLNFTLKVNLFAGADDSGSVITKTLVDLGNPDERHESEGDLNNFSITDKGWTATFKADS